MQNNAVQDSSASSKSKISELETLQDNINLDESSLKRPRFELKQYSRM